MPMKLYDTKDAVPEAQREAAIETKDGKFAVAESEDLGEKGKDALEKERKARKDEKARADAAEAEAERLRLAAKAAEGKVSDTAHAELRTEYEKKVSKEKERADVAEQKMRNREKERLLDKYLLAAGVMPKRLEKARKDVWDRFDLNDAGDDLIGGKDEKGKPIVEGAPEYLSTAYKAEAAFFFSGVNSSGSGAEESDGGGGSDYDPVKAGKAAAAQQKQSATDNALAFK